MPTERNMTKAEQAKYRRERKAEGICGLCDGKSSPKTWCKRCSNTGKEPTKHEYTCYNCLNGLHIHSAKHCTCSDLTHRKRPSRNDQAIAFVTRFAKKGCEMWHRSNCFVKRERRFKSCLPCQAKKIMGIL